jgi:acyl CoA:acetate/3-ketoacid CoA transferase alpha subunit
MKVLQEGTGKLVGWHDPDENRKWIAENKTRELVDKTMTAKEAVEKFVFDGAYIASGGFGHVRVSMSVIYEIIRQKKRDLTLAGKTAVHDLDILVGSGCVNKVEAAYSFAHELRGLSPASRRMVESGRCKAVAEISNAGYQWRFLGGMMGVPFIPARSMLGTDTLTHSACKVVECPFTGKPITLIPSCNPDVAFIHVHRCDIYGNSQIDGIAVEDFELARAARRLIITTEEIIDNEKIREKPYLTTIPFYHVDAVVEQPFGCHPCLMPYKYYFDEEHIGEWLKLSKTEEGANEYFDKYVFSVKDYNEYIAQQGGIEKLLYLKKVEEMREPLKAPWIK